MKLENLISVLCPSGVAYSPLGALCKIETGKLNANAMNENGIYPFFTCDAKPFRINTYAFDTEAIIISGNGSQVGHINYYNGKFNAYQRTYVLSNFSGVSVSFLLHYLRGYLREHIYVNSRKGSVPYITLPMLQEFRIPLPPLPVQQEIVRILDSFTKLTAELTAELTARRKQYEHYKGLIFKHTFAHGTTMPLGDIATFSQGIQVEPKNQFYDMTSDRVRFLRIVDFVSENEPPRYIERPNSKYLKTDQELVMIRYGASAAGKVFMNHSGAIANNMFKINFHDGITPRFAMHYLSQTSIYLALNTSSGKSTMPAVNFKTVGQIPIPVVSISEQQRIVEILDRFDAICNDLTSGLPAEIAARQKQYEYYRDKLLTFKEKME